MANLLNTKVSAFSSTNQGRAQNTKEIGRIIGAIFIIKGSSFTAASTATQALFQAALVALSQNNNKYLRSYSVGNFADFKENDAADQTAKVPYGGSRSIARGIPSFSTMLLNGGMDEYQNLVKLHNKHTMFDMLLIDESNTIYGSVNAAGLLCGISLGQLWVPKWDLPTSSDYAKYMLTIQLARTSDIVENLRYFDVGVDVLALTQPFTDIQLVGVDSGVKGVFTMSITAGYSNEDLTNYFATPLATSTNWLASVTTSGSSIVVTSATVTAGTPGFQGSVALALVTTTPYPSAPDKVTITLAAPSVLTTNGLVKSDGGFECTSPAFVIVTE